MTHNKEINPIELSYHINSKNFTLDIYFIQVLVYLCNEDILKIHDQKTQIIYENQLYKKSIFVCISKNFFSYKPDRYTKDFLIPFSAKKQKIKLIEFIHLIINNKISDKKWKTIFNDNKIKFHENYYLNKIKSESKYFDFTIIIDSNSNQNILNNNKYKIFIKNLSINNLIIFDLIFEETKKYISKKKNNTEDWHWGKGNSSPAF